jgi:hypothetical protein
MKFLLVSLFLLPLDGKKLKDVFCFSDEQICALDKLLKKSGAFAQDDSMLNHYPDRDTDEALIKDCIDFIELTQKYFVRRPKGQERWEVEKQNWTADIREICIPFNLEEPIIPSKKYDAVGILGSLRSSMQKRFDFFNVSISYPIKVFLVSGVRDAEITRDGTEKELLQIANRQKRSLNELTEFYILKDIFEVSGRSNLEVIYINTPKKEGTRPTTETTLVEVSKQLKKSPSIKSVVFVSSQPHAAYQKAIISAVLIDQNCDVEVDVIAPAVAATIYGQDLVGALGSTFWAQLPLRLESISNISKEIKDQLLNFYKGNDVLKRLLDKKIS